MDQEALAKRFPPFTFTVERAKVEELRYALGHSDSGDSVVPPIFLNSSIQTGITGMNPVEGMGISRARALHAGQQYHYYDVVYVGDVLTGETIVAGVTEKVGRSGRLRFYDLETTFLRDDEPVVVVNTRVAERLLEDHE